MTKTKLVNSIAVALGAAVVSSTAQAQLEEIVVTATKRAESSQDIPVAIQAISGDTLDELGVSTFDEYVKYLPNVTQQGRGPGRSEIYIRGVASEQANNTVSSVNGSAPTVAVYLDEQPASFGGRNIDIYAADLQRVEVLPGPQGTLFGASSQSGTVRLITNKPSTEGFEADIKAGYAFTTGGDPSTTLEAAINVPLTDKLAVRAVVYSDTQGGWIDNVADQYVDNDAALVEVFNRNQAFGNVSADANVIDTSNAAFIQDNWNEAQYTGVRIGLSYDFNDDWNILVQHTDQDLDTEGSFEFAAVGGESDQSQSFAPERNSDSFSLTTWTVEGRVGALDLVYTGGLLQRDVNSLFDYSIYSFTGGYQNYYISTNNIAYGREGSDTIFDQTKQFLDDTQNERFTHELRVQGEVGERFRFTAGGFLDDVETNSIGQFQYFGAFAAGFDTATRPAGGNPEGVNDPNGRATATIFTNDFTRDEEQTALFADVTYDISDSFTISAGARYYDIDFGLTGATGGAFGGCQSGPDITFAPIVGPNEVATGVSRALRPDGSFGCTAGSGNNVTDRLDSLGGGDVASFQTFFGADGGQAIADAIASGDLSVDALDSTGTSNQSDTLFRFTADWKVGDSALLFATFSEGFRPQTVNRNSGQAASQSATPGPFFGFRVPAVVETDELTNFEIGLKGDFFDNRLRLNATAYTSEIDNLQASRFDPANVGILVFLENIGDAEVSGLDLDFTWLATNSLTFQGAVSFVDSEITRLNSALEGIAAPVGSELPFTADVSFNLRGRYDFRLNSYDADAYVSAGLVYTGDSLANITADANFIEDQSRRLFGNGTGLQIENLNGTFGSTSQATAIANSFGVIDTPDGEFFQAGRFIQESYTLFNVSAGLNKDTWGAELYIDNLFDEDGIVNINTFDGTPRVSVTRPRTVGVRFNWSFN